MTLLQSHRNQHHDNNKDNNNNNNNNSNTIQWVLIGGRDEKGVVPDSMYTLSMIFGKENNGMHYHFVWEPILIDNAAAAEKSIPRFHHASVVLLGDDDDDDAAIFVFGGLSKCNDNLLEPFSSINEEGNNNADDFFLNSFVLEKSTSSFSDDIQTTTRSWHVKSVDESDCLNVSSSCRRFGHSACVVPPHHLQNHDNTGADCSAAVVVCSTGGIMKQMSRSSSDSDSLVHFFKAIKQKTIKSSIWKLQDLIFDAKDKSNTLESIGTLVHHGCIYLSPSQLITSASMSTETESDIESTMAIAVVGGGVPGFSFSPCYAESCMFHFVVDRKQLSTEPTTERIPKESSSGNGLNSKISKNRNIASIQQQDQKNSTTDVLFVHPKDAKKIKMSLEKSGLLNKTYRMVKINLKDEDVFLTNECIFASHSKDETLIAVPITASCRKRVQEEMETNGCLDATQTTNSEWASHVRGVGRWHLPFSTGVFARHTVKAKK